MSKHDFDKKLTTSRGRVVEVSTSGQRGCWERLDGSEGGELLFEPTSDGKLELIDYDGCFELPADIAPCLREAGFVVAEDF